VVLSHGQQLQSWPFAGRVAELGALGGIGSDTQLKRERINMIIWSGLGFLPVIFLMVIGFAFYDRNTWTASDAPLAYTLLLTGLVSGVLGWFLRKRGTQTLVDKATGKEVTVRRTHSLFFIPMFYWGPILIAWGLFLLVKQAMRH